MDGNVTVPFWVKRSALAGNSGLIPGNNSPVITVPQAMVVIAMVVLKSYFISNFIFLFGARSGPITDPSILFTHKGPKV